MLTKRIAVACLVALASASAALADGLIVPVRPEIKVRGDWVVKYHHVKLTVRDQVASVAVTQEFENTSRGMMEVQYIFPVPPGAAIDGMTLTVNDQEYKAELYKADEARKIYEEIVRRKKDPALLEYVDYGMYRTRAFPLEPGKPAKVVVHYNYICKRDQNLVEVWYPLNTEKYSAKPIEEVKVVADIKADQDITSVYSPSHDIKLERNDARHVIANWSDKNVLPGADFQLFYKLSDKAVAASFLTFKPSGGKDGYFLMLVSPSPAAGGKTTAVPKDVVLAFDHSGSMGGEKIEQARDAVKYVIENLNEGDRFNVIPYSDGVEKFYDELVENTAERRRDAIDRLERIEAGGGTAIHEALTTAMQMCKKDSGRPTYVIFMTDGLATIGKTDDKSILADTAKANKCDARLFAFGVGYNVNVRLLDNLVRENNGRSEYVKPKEDVEAKVSALYRKIKNPVMTEVAVKVPGVRLRDMYPRQIGDLFEGDQLVIVGRYELELRTQLESLPLETQLLVSGQYMGKERVFEYPLTVGLKADDTRFAFVERLWAMRRIGYLLDQIQLAGETKEVVDEVVRLSKDYGIITPYTSFLAREDVKLGDKDVTHRHFRREADRLGASYKGAGGQMDAVNRQILSEASRPSAAPADGNSTAMIGHSDQDAYEEGKSQKVGGVRQVGNQALYKRDRGWVTPQAAEKLEKAPSSAQTVERFSEEYFKLARANTVEENRILATQQEGEELVIELRGQLYRIK